MPEERHEDPTAIVSCSIGGRDSRSVLPGGDKVALLVSWLDLDSAGRIIIPCSTGIYCGRLTSCSLHRCFTSGHPAMAASCPLQSSNSSYDSLCRFSCLRHATTGIPSRKRDTVYTCHLSLCLLLVWCTKLPWSDLSCTFHLSCCTALTPRFIFIDYLISTCQLRSQPPGLLSREQLAGLASSPSRICRVCNADLLDTLPSPPMSQTGIPAIHNC
jgi:hypothetical protein